MFFITGVEPGIDEDHIESHAVSVDWSNHPFPCDLLMSPAFQQSAESGWLSFLLARQRVTLRYVLALWCGQPVQKAPSLLDGVETAPFKNGFMVISDDPGMTSLTNITGKLFRTVLGRLINTIFII